MILDRTRPLFCFIHDAGPDDAPDALWELPDSAWESVDFVQVRAKTFEADRFVELVRGWLDRLSELEIGVIVNDRLDVALATDVAGVHLGDDDTSIEEARERATEEEFVIGASAGDRDGTLIAQASGADYVGLGAFYSSRTKPEAKVLNPWKTGLMENIPALTIPVLAIGGMTPDRVDEAFRVPAVTGVAASAAIQGSDDPAAAIEAMRAALTEAWDTRVAATRS